ncbi:VOC family protein [Pontibacter russatus]|uniref:VOC family protein n=1 Tax=Pontibacter russatus TaxID=2694929 RepID=UPI00137A4D9B|nr:VOC family protein [Pontibacter russatus]
MTHELYPCLWFDGTAKEAAELYLAAFKNSKITSDTPLVVTLELGGQKFMGLNGGPMFTPNPSISFYVVCETASEMEQAWASLSEGGKVLMPLDKYPWSEQYGWVQDKFGVSWQLALDKLENVGQKFTPSLMFTGQQAGKAEEAIQFYTSLFDNSSIVGILRYNTQDQDVEGTVKHAQFKLGQQVFMAMDSSYPHDFGFNEGISLVILCDTQAEIDYYWDKLTEGGLEVQCGWLKDRYGVSWQVVPAVLEQLMREPEKASRTTQAFMKMKKLDIQQLVDA